MHPCGNYSIAKILKDFNITLRSDLQVLAKAMGSAHLPDIPPLLPMVVLSPKDRGFWLEGEGYETACDQSGHWSAQDIATEHISVSTDVTPFQFVRYFKNKVCSLLMYCN